MQTPVSNPKTPKGFASFKDRVKIRAKTTQGNFYEGADLRRDDDDFLVLLERCCNAMVGGWSAAEGRFFTKCSFPFGPNANEETWGKNNLLQPFLREFDNVPYEILRRAAKKCFSGAFCSIGGVDDYIHAHGGYHAFGKRAGALRDNAPSNSVIEVPPEKEHLAQVLTCCAKVSPSKVSAEGNKPKMITNAVSNANEGYIPTEADEIAAPCLFAEDKDGNSCWIGYHVVRTLKKELETKPPVSLLEHAYFDSKLPDPMTTDVAYALSDILGEIRYPKFSWGSIHGILKGSVFSNAQPVPSDRMAATIIDQIDKKLVVGGLSLGNIVRWSRVHRQWLSDVAAQTDPESKHVVRPTMSTNIYGAHFIHNPDPERIVTGHSGFSMALGSPELLHRTLTKFLIANKSANDSVRYKVFISLGATPMFWVVKGGDISPDNVSEIVRRAHGSARFFALYNYALSSCGKPNNFAVEFVENEDGVLDVVEHSVEKLNKDRYVPNIVSATREDVVEISPFQGKAQKDRKAYRVIPNLNKRELAKVPGANKRLRPAPASSAVVMVDIPEEQAPAQDVMDDIPAVIDQNVVSYE